MLWLLPIAALAGGDAGPPKGPHTDAAYTVGLGYVGYGPGVAFRAAATAGYWGWAHGDLLLAARIPSETDAANPFVLGGVELGITPPTRRGVAGAALALDIAGAGGADCFDNRGCLIPYAGPGLGAVWAIENDSGGEFEAFVGVGLYTYYDAGMPSWRLRLAWTTPKHVRIGVVGTGALNLLVEVGRAW